MATRAPLDELCRCDSLSQPRGCKYTHPPRRAVFGGNYSYIPTSIPYKPLRPCLGSITTRTHAAPQYPGALPASRPYSTRILTQLGSHLRSDQVPTRSSHLPSICTSRPKITARNLPPWFCLTSTSMGPTGSFCASGFNSESQQKMRMCVRAPRRRVQSRFILDPRVLRRRATATATAKATGDANCSSPVHANAIVQ
ncbi:hypothetical protein C8Q74DRAFT_524796 [Fomes fomentarius]|nr:hypothetical protein C8Q74DRAFT_524796 [Fomes fomentarius]